MRVSPQRPLPYALVPHPVLPPRSGAVQTARKRRKQAGCDSRMDPLNHPRISQKSHICRRVARPVITETLNLLIEGRPAFRPRPSHLRRLPTSPFLRWSRNQGLPFPQQTHRRGLIPWHVPCIGTASHHVAGHSGPDLDLTGRADDNLSNVTGQVGSGSELFHVHPVLPGDCPPVDRLMFQQVVGTGPSHTPCLPSRPRKNSS